MKFSIFKDILLKPFSKVIEFRYNYCQKEYNRLTQYQKISLSEVANNHLFFGLHQTNGSSWIAREYAPNAQQIYLLTDSNHWQQNEQFAFHRKEHYWELLLPKELLKHRDCYKLLIIWDGGYGLRIPAYARRVVQDEHTKLFAAQVWNPKESYHWKSKPPQYINKNPLIYEAHVGMATEQYKVGSYVEFTKNILPKIKELGYNTLQLMAIQEYPYYGSFGYQVSNFFAPSSRYGTPEELKLLVDTAHDCGLFVIMDLVHSHAVKNEEEGLSNYDGTPYCYFHSGEKGNHPVWDSKCFDFGKDEVCSFLLSNCKYWIEEFRFDGFRFDGVTSMLYDHHGLGKNFTSYNMYFDEHIDIQALSYLSLANMLIHEINPKAITIAEEVSGMPGLSMPIKEGGLGFDFRMSMGIADYWIKILKEKEDKEWHVGDIFYELTNKREDEKTISYAECHDQALVGDITIAFRLMDKEMYTSMNVFEHNLIIDRGIALHKMIRLITLASSGEGYLTFMGNEFGHPEWIDFPRQGNNWNYHYARRQWNLLADKNLRYHFLWQWDKAIIHLAQAQDIFNTKPCAILQNIVDQVLIFQRGNLLFAFNFHPTQSFTDYSFDIHVGTYELILNSDNPKFDGFGRVQEPQIYFTQYIQAKNKLLLYLPSRTAIVLKYVQ
ncbi:MAG: alpha amylase C-terminal domain-containing protein [Chitinophagaceae bacterium]